VSFEIGPAARGLAADRALTRLVERELGIRPQPPRQAAYQYYDWPGAGLIPHLDKFEVVLSMVVMLEHEPAEGESAFVFHPANRPPLRLKLKPGEVIAFEGRGLVHEREPVREGERVTILVIGTRGPTDF
jgi:alkylated DNA repair dioxygenase AlkB